MKRILKYELMVADHSKLCLPIGARILSIQAQRNAICLWAVVDECQKELCLVDIFMYATGQNISDKDLSDKRFAGTVQLGELVFHVFLQYDNNIQYLIV
jgi:hypothetical protein|nr:MAG TPA: hypothetical protein [Caudoviricetes sp.]